MVLCCGLALLLRAITFPDVRGRTSRFRPEQGAGRVPLYSDHRDVWSDNTALHVSHYPILSIVVAPRLAEYSATGEIFASPCSRHDNDQTILAESSSIRIRKRRFKNSTEKRLTT